MFFLKYRMKPLGLWELWSPSQSGIKLFSTFLILENLQSRFHSLKKEGKMNRKFLLWAFAISGFTALVYEIVWSRPLQIIFGSTIYAVSTILTTFFVGFALGSYVLRNVADNSKNPVKLFAMLQLGIGLYG